MSIILLGTILIAMSLLTENYLTRGFWGDEAWTSLISQLPYMQMLKTTAADFHPPAYYTIIELLYKILPPTEVVTRSVSILFYFATAFLVYKLASEFKGKAIGFLSALVVLVNPIFFTYAFEARNYTLFAFAATGSVYSLLKLSQKFSLGSILLFIFFSTLGIYTHYYMFFVLAAGGLYVLLFDRRILLKMIGLWAAVFVLYLPWIPFLYHQVTSVSGSYWISSIDKNTHYEAFMRILGGEQDNPFKLWLFRLSTVLLVVGLFQHIRKKSFEKPYLLIWLWAIVPFILASLPGLRIDSVQLPFRPIFFWRYLIGASVPLSMLIVHALPKLGPKLFGISIALVITLSVVIDFLTFFRNPYGFRQVYQEKVVPEIKQGDVIVTILPSFAEVLYYRNRNGLKNEVVVLPEGLVQFSGKSLLDAYIANGIVRITDSPQGKQFEMRQGPKLEVKVDSQSEK